jgi:hypothetical protein
MKLMIAVGSMMISGGCAGMPAEFAWPDPGPAPESRASLAEPFASVHKDSIATDRLSPRRSYSFKCEDEAMSFENTPLPTMSLNPVNFHPQSIAVPPVPGTLMEPWRRFASESTMSAPLYWQRGVPGITDNGFPSLSGQTLR